MAAYAGSDRTPVLVRSKAELRTCRRIPRGCERSQGQPEPSGPGRRRTRMLQGAGRLQGARPTAQGTPQPPRASCSAALDLTTRSPAPLRTATPLPCCPVHIPREGLQMAQAGSTIPVWGERAPYRPGACPSSASCRSSAGPGGRAPLCLLCDQPLPKLVQQVTLLKKEVVNKEACLQFLKIEV